MPKIRVITLLLLVSPLIPDLASGNEHDWGQVMRLEQGTSVWIRTNGTALTELVIARVTEEAVRVGVANEMKSSKAPRDRILSGCATPSEGRLVSRGEVVDFTRLCRAFERDEVVEVYAKKKKSPFRAIAIGGGIGAAAALAPCRVAPQANGSVAGCVSSGACFGALVGWIVHAVRRSEPVLVYSAN